MAGASYNKIGRYDLLQQISKAYLGPLWVARVNSGDADGYPALVRRVVVPSGASEEASQDIAEVAWDALEITHPCVLKVAEVVFEGGDLALAYDYEEGEVLQGLQLLSGVKKKPPGIPLAGRMMLDILDGLIAVQKTAQEFGIDPFGGVTPESILVSSEGQTFVLDALVGAKASGLPALVKSATKIGYASPEQLKDTASCNERSDVFSAGVILWELLAARRFLLGAPSLIERKLTEGPLPELRKAARSERELPDNLIELTERALALNPEERFSSLEELRSALRGALDVASHNQVGAWVQEMAERQFETRRAKLGAEREARVSHRVISNRPKRLAKGATEPTSKGLAAPGTPTRLKPSKKTMMGGVGAAAIETSSSQAAEQAGTGASKGTKEPAGITVPAAAQKASPFAGPAGAATEEKPYPEDDEPTAQLSVAEMTARLEEALPESKAATGAVAQAPKPRLPQKTLMGMGADALQMPVQRRTPHTERQGSSPKQTTNAKAPAGSKDEAATAAPLEPMTPAPAGTPLVIGGAPPIQGSSPVVSGASAATAAPAQAAVAPGSFPLTGAAAKVEPPAAAVPPALRAPSAEEPAVERVAPVKEREEAPAIPPGPVLPKADDEARPKQASIADLLSESLPPADEAHTANTIPTTAAGAEPVDRVLVGPSLRPEPEIGRLIRPGQPLRRDASNQVRRWKRMAMVLGGLTVVLLVVLLGLLLARQGHNDAEQVVPVAEPTVVPTAPVAAQGGTLGTEQAKAPDESEKKDEQPSAEASAEKPATAQPEASEEEAESTETGEGQAGQANAAAFEGTSEAEPTPPAPPKPAPTPRRTHRAPRTKKPVKKATSSKKFVPDDI